MRKKIISWLCAVALLCTMIPFSTVTANAVTATLNDTDEPVDVNTKYTRQLESARDQDQFVITITEDCYFDVSFTVDTNNSEEIKEGWHVKVYALSNKDLVHEEYNTKESFKTSEFFASRDTYYIMVEPVDECWGNEEKVPVNVPYSIMVNCTEKEIVDTASNDTLSNATNIEINKTYSEVIEERDTGRDVDYYKFDITEPGYFKLIFKHGEGDVNLGWIASIYNENMQLIRTHYIKSNYESIEHPAGAGSYYVKVEGNGDGSSWYDPIDVEYNIQIQHTESDVWEIEDNGTSGKANLIQLNKNYSGMIEERNAGRDVDYYKFAITESGYFNLMFNHVDGDVNLGWIVSLYNKKEQLIRTHYIDSNYESIEYPVAPGTYYIKVEGNGDGSSWYDPINVQYIIQIKHTITNAWESEDNDTFNKADAISLNEYYNGLLYRPEDVDLFKFDITEKGYFNIVMGPQNIGDELVDYGWKLSLYDPDGKLLGSDQYTELTESIKYAFKPGTYYVKVESYLYGFGGYDPADCIYKLCINQVASSDWESEYNDSKSTANIIKTNTAFNYKGNLYDKADKDYFKFTIPANGKVKLTMVPGEYTENCDNGWNVSIVNANTGTTQLLSNVLTVKSKAVTLKKGTYYVLVESASSYDVPVGAEYGFNVKYTRNPAKPVISKVTSKNKAATIKWKKASYATGYYIYRSTTGKAGSFKQVAKTTKLTFTNKNLKKGKKYYYKVKAYRTYNEVTSVSDFSKIKSIKVK